MPTSRGAMPQKQNVAIYSSKNSSNGLADVSEMDGADDRQAGGGMEWEEGEMGAQKRESHDYAEIHFKISCPMQPNAGEANYEEVAPIQLRQERESDEAIYMNA